MEKILAIGDRETILGFQMAGVNGIESDAQLAEALVADILSGTGQQNVGSGAGLLILQDDFLQGFSLKTKKLIDLASKVVIVSVPSRFGSKIADGEDFAKMVKRAIGVDLKQ